MASAALAVSVAVGSAPESIGQPSAPLSDWNMMNVLSYSPMSFRCWLKRPML
ncbi:hypothetical protein AWB67_07506 [Caballeronia terrestris]|uniref:Uncharacterized protein n=1 Tax=Caballeronia terrestris TaxID=1226301 RepID=A0A158L4S3_9BURK|nr:hypothetical protein AWB67_07506 [Caballeronia terrestris]